MPASGTREGRAGRRLLSLLFWAGVALAPVAALLLLLAKGEGPLRIAAVLAVLAVVLIGLSITLRKDSATVRLELEETFLEEVDLLREDLRQDITTAARATHRQFQERLQGLYESVESLRGHLEAVRHERMEQQFAPQRSQVGYGPAGMPGPAPAGGGHGGSAHAGSVNGGPTGQPHAGQPHAGQPHAGPSHAGPSHAGPSPAGRAGVGGGVVRHTETVQVTTRHTVVDPHGDGSDGRGTVYGGAPYATGYGRAEPQRAEPSWTEQRLREQYGQRAPEAGPDHRGSAGPDARRPRPSYGIDDTGSSERWGTGRPAESAWSARRAGPGTVEDRWASVRSDDRGRELRIGERRAALHADESGTELHIEDRWASVRREEPRGGRRRAEDRRPEDRRAEDRRPEDRRPEDRRAEDRRPEDRWGGGGGDGWSESRWGTGVEDTGRWGERRAQPALPATSSESTWSERWSETRGEGGRRRYRDEEDDSDVWEAQPVDPPVRTRERWS